MHDFERIVRIRVPLSPSSIIWYRVKAVMLFCWKGNEPTSGVAVAMRYVLNGLREATFASSDSLTEIETEISLLVTTPEERGTFDSTP